MSFNQTFTIYNYTSSEMTLDEGNSKNLSGVWPATVPAATAANEPGTVTFSQNVSMGDINPTAVYIVQSNPAINANLHFYCVGAGLVHVNMTMSLSSQNFPIAIWENNSNTDNDEGVSQSSQIGAPLSIDTTNGGSSRGSAKFVLGQTTIPS